MCGIVGVRGWTDEKILTEMLDLITHRGPDDEGRFLDEDAQFMMGARRLAIVDIANGKQPVTNEDGSVVAVFNGEIYNHGVLRDRLRSKGHQFRSDCDTEVLVHLWEEHGPDLVNFLDGMFAFSVWDRSTETLVLARDRLGVKPVYYSDSPDGFVWGSELQALLAANITPTLDPIGVYNYFRLEHTMWPRTLVSSIKRLPPAGIAIVTPTDITIDRYWEPSDGGAPTVQTFDQAVQRLRTVLEDAVDRRLMADVPVGAFLSGGLDSSAVAAIMAHRLDTLKTFSVTFPGKPYDESSAARSVADYLGTDHHEVSVDLESLDEFESLVGNLSEPPSHAQFLPIYALSELAHNNDVKVVLAGEGADELFGGYPRYRTVRRARRLVGALPKYAYDAANRIADVTPVGRLHLKYFSGLRDLETAVLEHNCGLNCLRPRPEEFLFTNVDDETSGLASQVRSAIRLSGGEDAAEAMMTHDIIHRLPDNILFKTDHTSMATSLEVRVPFLDHRLVEFAHSLPASYRVTPKNEKAILKQAVSDIVPPRVLDRKKHAMGIPVGSWFRSDHDVIARWLTERRLDDTPYVDPERVRSLWDDHRSGRDNYGRTLWTILSFVGWYHSVIAPVANSRSRRSSGRESPYPQTRPQK